MADIDNLSIQISASAESAEKSIDSLISSLRRLNRNLALGNVSTFARQMREITNSANGLKDASSAISSIATAGRKLGDLSGYKTVNDQIRETEKEAKNLAKSIGESFNFKGNGASVASKNVKDLTMLIEVMFDKLAKGKSIASDGDLFSAVLPSMQGFKTVLDEDYQKIKAFTEQYKVFVDEFQKNDLASVYGSLSKASKELGVKFVDDKALTNLHSIEEYLLRIKELTGIDFMKDSFNSWDGLQNLVDYLKDYQRAAEQAAKSVIGDDSFYKAEGEKLVQTVKDIYDRIHDETQVKNPFEGIVEGLKSLQGIQIPDFTNLNTLADAITRLNGVSPKNLKEIAKALKDISGSNIKVDGVENVAKAAESVNEVAKPLQEVEKEATKAGNAIALLVDKSYGFKDIGGMFNNASDFFSRMQQDILKTMFQKNMRFDLVDTGRVTFDSLRDAVQEVSSSFELACTAIQHTGEEIIDVTDSFRELSGSADEVENHAEKTAKAVEEVGEAAKKAKPDLTELFEGLSEGLTDDFSAMMHDVLLDMDKYSSIVSNMKSMPTLFYAKDFEDATKKLKEATNAWETYQRTVDRKTRLGLSDQMSEASKEAQRLQERIHDLRRMMADMENEKTIVNVEQYKAWAKELDTISARYDELMGKKKEVEKPVGNIDLLANLVAMGHEIGNIANAFDKLGNTGIKALKLAFKPLDIVIKEYKEKIESIGDSFKGFVDNAKKHLNKLSAFWKRSMKTFTFMLVRKAITAVLTEINDAVKSLAIWSKQFGTVFNDSMSQITSNLSYMARAIVGAFEPIINFVVPAFNALADAVANAMAKLGEFFAAMTGQGYYMAAKRQVTDYAESVDKANKAQKNLIAGLDDLNVITTPTSTQNGMDDVAAQWEKIDVSDKMKDFAEKIKALAKRLFDPIKKAWDNVGDHVKEQFKFMFDNLKKLLKDIGRDWLEVWEQPETQKILERIFEIIGNIAEGIGWIALRFDEAWNNAKTGKKILENIRDIIGIIVEHIYNMSVAFVDWAKNLDFNPLLQAVEEFTRKVQPLIDFLGNLIEYWWEKVVLRHWKWLIEEGIPHLLHAIGEVIDAFNFDKILEDLKPVMDAFETMRENIETGIVNAFKNLGLAIADFANSEDFTNFTKNVAWFMEQITAERVEKLFTALGTAILDVAEALMRFVGSDRFKKFMEGIFEWYDSLSVEDIAGFIRKIALAIAVFKFTAFVGKGFAGFMSFLSILTSGKGLLGAAGGILKGIGNGLKTLFSGLGSLLGGAGKGIGSVLTKLIPSEGVAADIFGAIGAAFKTVGSVLLKGSLIAAIVVGVLMVINNWDKIEPVLRTLAQTIFKGLGMALGGLASFLGEQIAGAISKIGDYFKQQAEECGGNIILGILVGIVKAIVAIPIWIYDNVVKPFIDGLKEGFGIHSPAETMIPIGEFLIGGLLEGILGAMSAIGAWLYEHVVQPIIDFFGGAVDWLVEGGKNIIEGIKNGIDAAKEGLAAKWEEIKEEAAKAWKRICDDAEKWWSDIKDTIHGVAEELRKNLEDKWNEVKQNAIDAWDQFKTDANDWWDKIRKTIHDIADDLRRKLYQRWEDVKRDGANAWNSFKTTAQQKWQAIRDTIVGFADNVKTTLQGIWENVKTTAEGIWNNIKGSAESIWSGIKNTIVGFASSAAEEASHAFWNLVDWASDAFGGVVRAAGDILGRVPSTIQSALSGAGTAIQSALGGLGDVASNALGGIVTAAKSIGGDIVGGITSGIQNAQQKNTLNPTNSLSKMYSNMIKDSKKDLKINSPSKVFAEIGSGIVEGVTKGISDNEKDTEKEINSWMKNLSKVTLPTFNLDAAVPKSSLRMDSYQHTDFTGTATLDQQAMQDSMRSAIQESIGSLILPYLNDIANSSRETANKNLTISAKDVHTAVRVEDKRFKTQTGRSAFAY